MRSLRVSPVIDNDHVWVYECVCVCVCVCVYYWDPTTWVQSSVSWMTKLINSISTRKMLESTSSVWTRWERSSGGVFLVKKAAADLHIILHFLMDISSQGWFSVAHGSSNSLPSLPPGVLVPAFREHINSSYTPARLRELCVPHRNGFKYWWLNLRTQNSGLQPLCEISAWDLWGNVELY